MPGKRMIGNRATAGLNRQARRLLGLIIDVCLSCLGTQIPLLEGIRLPVLDEVGSALTEFKGHILPDTLFPQGKHPVIIHGSGITVRFTACHYQFHTG